MIVHKFGGTSLENPARFISAAEIAAEQHGLRRSGAMPTETVVVVSAMAGVTSRLIAGARSAAEGHDGVCREIKTELLSRHLETARSLLRAEAERLSVCGFIEDRFHELDRLYRSIAPLGELTARGTDAVASFGEPLSAAIFAAVLRERGLAGRALPASELIVTDDNFGAANPFMEPTRIKLEERVRPLLEKGILPVITGYIGGTEKGVVTTLGRGGSDFSAALIGACLGAEEVRIWSDVDGIMTADPNLVPRARTLERLTYSEASALAHYGADVLHSKTITPLAERGIPLRILNSLNPSHPGTLILDNGGAACERLPAIVSTMGLSLIAVGTQDDSLVPAVAARALHRLGETGVEVLMFSRSFSDHSLHLVVRDQDKDHCLKSLAGEFAGRRVPEDVRLEVKEKVATVSVAGRMDWNGKGLVSHAFAALGRLGTRAVAVAQAAGGCGVSFCIPEADMAETVRFLHHDLGLEGQP
ncbi:MAG: aspartate kinase [Acidobacteriota bacterium]|nr:aspartate kinase [Acidobacteriota bacterium]